MKPEKKLLYTAIILFCLLLAACAHVDKQRSQYHQEIEKEHDFHFVQKHEDAVDDLVASCIMHIDKRQPIIVAGLVNIDDMGKSSTLGRMSSEIIAGRLARHGFRVKEVKMPQDSIYAEDAQGELILSRGLHRIAEKHSVQGFVLGTYAVGEYRRYDADVYISIRFVDINNIIGCASNYIIKNTDPKLWK